MCSATSPVVYKASLTCLYSRLHAATFDFTFIVIYSISKQFLIFSDYFFIFVFRPYLFVATQKHVRIYDLAKQVSEVTYDYKTIQNMYVFYIYFRTFECFSILILSSIIRSPF
jgi:hypothetical protein